MTASGLILKALALAIFSGLAVFLVLIFSASMFSDSGNAPLGAFLFGPLAFLASLLVGLIWQLPKAWRLSVRERWTYLSALALPLAALFIVSAKLFD